MEVTVTFAVAAPTVAALREEVAATVARIADRGEPYELGPVSAAFTADGVLEAQIVVTVRPAEGVAAPVVDVWADSRPEDVAS